MKAVLLVVVLAAVLAAVSARPLTEEQHQFLFTRFAEQYGKSYEMSQIFEKYATFKTNMNFILDHNKKNSSYKLAMNQFGDLSVAQFKAIYLKLKPRRAPKADKKAATKAKKVTGNSPSFDWRTKGAVTPVKDQGQCGSCWAFSATGSVEGANFVKNKKLVSVSEQQLVDCAGSTGNEGCNGGLMDYAFEWIIQNKGICTETSYPYMAVDQTCKKTCKPAVTLSSYVEVAQKDENALMTAVNIVPVSIAIEADQAAFQFYSSGVFNADCGDELDHGVLVVGYGTDTGLDYWQVKNSWGTGWGESGYIRMVRGQNECGLADQPVYAVA